jgi:hypothetical protein
MTLRFIHLQEYSFDLVFGMNIDIIASRMWFLMEVLCREEALKGSIFHRIY